MIFAPPRHTKSELASRRFPAWYLGRHPERQIIATSYNSDLASDFGRDVRNIVASPEFGRLYETVGLAPDSKAADRWNTNAGGAYIAAGVGTAVTGRGAHIALIDDPLKDRQEANSEVIRQRLRDWYRAVLYTRLMPGGAIVLIQTRWHEDDLAGWLQEEAQRGGEAWDILSLPALAEPNDPLGRPPGEPLWPEWYGIEALSRTRVAIGEREWASLYQQRPTPEEGAFFLREWLRWYDEPPKRDLLTIYGASDYAVTAQDGDWTVHGVAGLDPDQNLFLLDWWRGQTDSAAWIDQLINLVRRWRPVEWAEEGGQISKSLGPFIDRRQRESQTWCARKQFPSVADKPTRAQAIRGRVAQGKLYLPRRAPWAEELVAEMMTFPNGKHDDQIDTLSLFGRMLMTMTPKRLQPLTPVSQRGYDPLSRNRA